MKTTYSWARPRLWMFVLLSLSSLKANAVPNATIEGVVFQNIDLAQASQSGKKIMISFSAEWCLPCRFMEENLYNDSEIADLVNENFVAVKADVDAPQGQEWNALYNSDFLPTILFADAKGVEFERITRAPNRSEFLEALRRVIAMKATPYRAHNHSSASAQIVGSTVQPTDTYIIQLGAFSSFDNASKRVRQLATIEDLDLMILEEPNNEGRLLYKVLCSEVESQTKAETIIQILRNEGIDCFVRKVH